MEILIGIVLFLIVPLGMAVLGLGMIVSAFDSMKDSMDKLKK